MNIALQYAKDHEEILKEGRMYILLKRVFDIVLSLAGITLLSPVFLIVSTVILLDSRGKVIFRQVRCGKDGKEFIMLKFRSMVCNAEELLNDLREKNEQTGPVFKLWKDPRVTRVGRFIRKTSLDELPQLFNVLKGDMSIVGPRPPTPQEVEQYNAYHKLRLLVKPGLTCYWQVMGRNRICFGEWVELDIRYIMERNLWIDFKLVLKTFKLLFGDENAS